MRLGADLQRAHCPWQRAAAKRDTLLVTFILNSLHVLQNVFPTSRSMLALGFGLLHLNTGNEQEFEHGFACDSRMEFMTLRILILWSIGKL